MNSNELRARFAGYCGDQRFRRFLECCASGRRLLFWQEELWERFKSATPLDHAFGPAEVQQLFCLCPEHQIDFSVVCYSTGAEVLLASQSEKGRFPYPFRCHRCLEAYEQWLERANLPEGYSERRLLRLLSLALAGCPPDR